MLKEEGKQTRMKRVVMGDVVPTVVAVENLGGGIGSKEVRTWTERLGIEQAAMKRQ